MNGPTMDRSLFADLTPARIALVYVVVGGAWIAFSDRLLVAALPPGPLFDAVMTGKGWVFVGVSGVLLYGMVSYRDEQLRATRMELERSKTQLSVLHRVLRHNLRNHCTVIKSCSDLIETGRVDEADMERIRRATDDLVALSEKSRHLKSLLETADDERTVDLRERLRTLVADLDESFPAATIETTLPDAAPVRIGGRFDVVVEELVRNAVDHHDADDPTVWISVTTDPAGTVRLDVGDDGPGIPEMERDVLEDGIEKPMFHSQGLGLWIVRVFVDQSDGDVRVIDNEPRGSIIRIQLPSATETAVA
ncbi:sensor histidine kinase [Halorientalis pallida]|uniref:sensor histidine kinase n=1 Tax=Halorientalis pallida TaxID=2479928 RepID=UPI003C6F8FDE